LTLIRRIRSSANTALSRACSDKPERFDDEREGEESKKVDVELFKAGEDAAETFDRPEQPFDLVALLIKGAVVLPGMDSVGLWRNHWNHTQIEQ
jgi:hypothetical protein